MPSRIKLWSPFEKFKIRNRIAMPPMSRHSTVNGGIPSPELAEYYLRRAAKGVGLIIVEAASIDAAASLCYIGGLQFHNISHMEAWKPIVDKIHNVGVKVWIQLYHVGRLTTPEIANVIPIAPSPLRHFPQKSHLLEERNGEYVHFQTKTPLPVPREMTLDDIREVQSGFAKACRLAIEAGFDGVELHGAHGYLLHQFSNRLTNKRKDAYGPDSDMFRFVRELVSGCRGNIPTDKVLSYRVSLHMTDLPFVRYSREEMDIQELVKTLEEWVDIFHCSEIKAGCLMFGHDKSLVEEVRSATAKPIIACGDIRETEQAEKLLNSGCVDIVSFGRCLIANPDYVQLMKNNEIDKAIKFQQEHMATIY